MANFSFTYTLAYPFHFGSLDSYLLHEHAILEASITMRKTSLWDPFVSIHLQ